MADIPAQEQRARRLAVSLLEIGDDGEAAKNQLGRWGFDPSLCRDAAAWAVDHHQHTWGPWRRVAADGGSPASRRDEDYVGHRRSCECGAFQHRHKESERAE